MYRATGLVVALLSAGLAQAQDSLQSVLSARISMPLEYQVDGVVEARRRATLSAEVAGTVESVNFDVDDRVEAGEIVMTIRDREYRARTRRAQAALDEAVANLRQVKLDYDRSRDLFRQKLISQADFDRAAATLSAAEARQESARAVLAEAGEQLERTVLRAPYAGVVVERHVEPGESVVPGQAIMSGYGTGQLRVSAQVPQSLVDGLRESRRARVVRLAGGPAVEVAEITIHPFANPKNHSFTARFDLPEDIAGLYPGMLVKVALTAGSVERLLLPEQALVSRSEVNAVYVIGADGRLSLRQVRPGSLYGDQVEILAGLDENERIALDPVRAGIEYKRQASSR